MNAGGAVDLILTGLALANFAMLATSRLSFYVTAVAFQGMLVALLPPLAGHGADPRVLALAAGTFALKGFVFPWLLRRVIRDVGVRREPEPFVGPGLSALAGVLLLLWALWLGARLPLPSPPPSPRVVPVSFFTVMVGLLIIVTRRTAVSQVLGFIVLENGVFAFGASLVSGIPLLVELGILLDVFVAVFVMGIVLFRISREFDHVDAGQLDALRDWGGEGEA